MRPSSATPPLLTPATSTTPQARAVWRTCSSTWPSSGNQPGSAQPTTLRGKIALAKVEEANAAYEAEYLKPVGRDPQKLAELEKTFKQAQEDAEKYVIPNQFTEIADRNGAEGLNAETGLDETQYFWSMPENRLELWAYMESSRLSDTVPREFYKERSVVIEERRMRTDSNPEGRLFEQFLATAYVAHNYGRSGVGWPSEVGQVNATEAMAFHKKYYVGANIVVAIVGDVKASEAMPMLEKYFSRVPGGTRPEEMTTIEPKQFAEKTIVIRDPSQPIYMEGYHRPDYRDPDDAVYDAISDILSNGRVSRLYRSLVRDQQIAAVAEGVSPYPGDKYPGLFVFYAAPLPGHTPQEMRDAIHKEIEKLKTADVTDDELAMYKTRTRADLLRGLADNQGLANDLAQYQTRYGDWRQLFLQLDKTDKVTKADIRRVANKVFVASNRTEAWTETEAPAAKTRSRERRRCAMSRLLVSGAKLGSFLSHLQESVARNSSFERARLQSCRTRRKEQVGFSP